MRVLHVIPSLHPSQGGPSTVMPQIAKALTGQGLTVDIACVDLVPETTAEGAWVQQTSDGYRILTFPPLLGQRRLSFAFMRWLGRHARDYDLIHVHGVLNIPCLMAERAAIRNGVPLIVRPLGILNRWGMENRKATLKKIWLRFLEKPLLDRAAAMHYTSREENDDVSRLGIRAPAQVLPLGLDMAPYEQLPSREIFRRRMEIKPTDKVVLFLSRIHPKKGLEVLLEAFARLRGKRNDVWLVVAGDGETGYISALHALTEKLGIADAVLWPGFLNPTERMQALAASDLFCLPSNSENFGIALLEAMAAGLPCISSPDVALAQEPPTQGAVRVVPRDPALWTEAMEDLLNNSEQARKLAARAVIVCREHYSTQQMGEKLTRLYAGLVPAKNAAGIEPAASLSSSPPLAAAGQAPLNAGSNLLKQITPVILTWNEEPNLRRCLARLTWAQEVVIIDSGSTDATSAIAADFPNVRFLTRKFDDHTSQWNFAVDQARTGWVLALDADYVLDSGFEDELAGLTLTSGFSAYFASFDYWVAGRSLRASLYPPRAVLFKADQCRYAHDGHTQLLQINGPASRLNTLIHHDDRKPLSRWIVSQDNYARLEADKLLATPSSALRLQDHLRRSGWAAIPAAFFFTLFVKGTLFGGWRGWFYTLQRTFAEILLAMRLVEKRLDRDSKN